MRTRRLRLASHVHSAWSDDCGWTLARLRRALGACGFDGALVCDHDRMMTEDRRQQQVEECRRITAAGFVMVPGVEYQDPDHVVHLPVFGDLPFYGRSAEIGDVLRAAEDAGAVSVFAHPVRADAWSRFDPNWVPLLTGLEVWNRKYDGVRPNAWAVRSTREHGLVPFVGLDFHGPRQLFPLAMVLEAGTPRTWAGVLAALREGRCRAEAFGRPVQAFSHGRMADTVRRAEDLRKHLAPRVRTVEHWVRRQPPGSSLTSWPDSGTTPAPPGRSQPGERHDEY
jgi:hypothetical protein